MSKERYTVETLAAGQPRPYADSVYHYRLTVEWQGLAGYQAPDAPFVPRPQLSPEIVKGIARGVSRGWVDNPGPFDRRLARFEMTAPGVWDVVIVEPYCD